MLRQDRENGRASGPVYRDKNYGGRVGLNAASNETPQQEMRVRLQDKSWDRYAGTEASFARVAKHFDAAPVKANPAISLLRDPKQAHEDDEVQGLGPVVERYDPAAARKAAKRRAKRAKRNR